jgi:monoamine oxidase
MFRKTNKNCNSYEFTFDFNKKNEHKIKRLNKNELLDVIIIGAGASGIAAANYLQQNGKKVIILEARNRIGGRIHDENIKGFGKIPLGAAWLHYKQDAWKNYDIKTHMLKELLDKCGVKYIKSDGLQNKENLPIYDSDGNLFINKEAMKILSKLPKLICQECKKYPEMILSECIKKILKKYNLQEDIINAFINRTTEHCSLNADLMRCKNYDCWEPNGDIVVDGYGKLITKLANNIKIKLNSEVIKIVQNDIVIVTTKHNKIYKSKYLILTIPLGVLKKGIIDFSPPLPKEKIDILKKNIYTGLHEKIFLSFPYKFWDSKIHVFHYADNKERGLCTQWQNLSFKKDKNILYTNLSGPEEKYVYKSDEELKDISMKHLKKIFGNNIPEPLDIYVTRWKLDPYTMGSAHSQPNLNGTMNDFKIIRKPFHKIFFAGVSTSESVTETVEAAILTGIRASKEILCL